MSITIKKLNLSEQVPQEEKQLLHTDYLSLVSDIEMQCTVRIGTIQLRIAELKDLSVGQVIQLQQKTHDPVEIMLGDRVIALGELMSHEDYFAVRITELKL